MDKHFFLAVAAYLVPTFPLGYFWHLRFFKRRYDALQVYRDDVVIPLGLASMIIQAVVYAWAYPRLFNTAPEAVAASAFSFAMVFGGLALTYSTLAVAAKHRMANVRGFVALEAAFTVVHFALVSPLIAMACAGVMV